MRRVAGTAATLAAALALSGGARAESAADPAAIEAQYRVAQRLAAEGDPGAAAAYEKVVAAAPSGPMADPALLGLARLRRIPEWPDDLAIVDADRAGAAAAALQRIVDQHPDGERAPEARYLLALLREAPLPGRDAAKARRDLIAVASASRPTPWSWRARYALGALDESSGADDRAAGAYARIVVERPDGEVVPRARAGYARTLLRAGRFGETLVVLGAAAAGEPLAAPSIRALALRALERRSFADQRWSAIVPPLAAVPVGRGAAVIAGLPDGGVFVWDRKTSTAQRIDARGSVTGTVPLEDVAAAATDRYGRVFVAVRDKVVRVDARGVQPVLSGASFGPLGAVAVDASGAVWVMDRRGDRIARAAPGGPLQIVRDARGAGVCCLVASGGRAIVAEEKTGRLVSVAPDGTQAGLGTSVFRRPVALAVDDAGQVAVLDEKTGTITLLGPDGSVRDALSAQAAGLARPLGLAFDPDGALRILDGASATVAVAP